MSLVKSSTDDVSYSSTPRHTNLLLESANDAEPNGNRLAFLRRGNPTTTTDQ